MGIICACLPVMRPLFYRRSLRANRARVDELRQSSIKVGQISQGSSTQDSSAQIHSSRDWVAEREAINHNATMNAYQHLGISPDDSWFEHVRQLQELGQQSIAATVKLAEGAPMDMEMRRAGAFDTEVKQSVMVHGANDEGGRSGAEEQQESYVLIDHDTVHVVAF